MATGPGENTASFLGADKARAKSEYNKKWGWFEIIKAVADYSNDTLPATFDYPIMMILTIYTLLIDKTRIL